MTQSRTDDTAATLLTRKQIAELLGVSDAKIRPYVEAAPEFFGAVDAQGKGSRFPASSVALFRRALLVTPGTFRKQIAGGNEVGASVGKDNDAPAVPYKTEGGEITHAAALLLPQEALTRFVEAAEQIAIAVSTIEAMTPQTPPDKLLAPKEAAALLSVSVGTLRRVIAPVRIGRLVRYKESEIFRYIASLNVSQ